MALDLAFAGRAARAEQYGQHVTRGRRGAALMRGCSRLHSKRSAILTRSATDLAPIFFMM